ncbi:hypothetical protein EVAR_39911_1 [Eumeta japonica]|uniref:Uncharacterized protein n=1 Tax=Eumeta variegata TaxID=151549 RepID=A0A4C1WPK2_EUMVA|nr:hypothetical protein EVAR_39911_1 [Eumeta japonica]
MRLRPQSARRPWHRERPRNGARAISINVLTSYIQHRKIHRLREAAAARSAVAFNRGRLYRPARVAPTLRYMPIRKFHCRLPIEDGHRQNSAMFHGAIS